MLTEYLTSNYMTLMILLALIVILSVNRRNAKIPAAGYYSIGIFLLFLVTVFQTVEVHIANQYFPTASQIDPATIRLRIIMSALSYILMPLIIMIEVLITAPNRTFRLISVIPAVLNALIYSTSFFGSSIAFTINARNMFVRGPLGITIYFILLFYVFMLALFSIIYFKWNNAGRSAIVLLIVIQSVISAALIYNNLLTRYSETIIALGMLEYYYYLSVIYQQEMRELVTEKELYITKQKMDLLRSQIQPHFIFNSLSVIRALAKHDSRKAVQCIDSFSDYLKAHIGSLQEDDMIPFEEELANAQAYLDLVQADTTRNIRVEYDLDYTNFRIPSLSLEPIVENSIKHGIGRKGGTIRIATTETPDEIRILISDDGTPEGGMTEQETARIGVGLDNTRKRLHMQCRGTLDLTLTDEGALVTITLPKETQTV